MLCKLLGHDLGDEYRYGRLTEGVTDGIGCVHARVYKKCRRCDQEQLVCQVHIPKLHREKQIEALVDKIRYAMDPVTEQEHVKELLALFDADSGR